MSKFRYPGAQPFYTNQQNIFFGRDEDIQRLYELISLEKLVVLFSKSGLGKSSLLNAGIIPFITKENKFQVIPIRIGAFMSDKTERPVSITRDHLGSTGQTESFLDRLIPGEKSLWRQVKHLQSSNPEQQGYLLIFDQFEELFTYPDTDVVAFKQQLAELLNNQIPQRFRAVLEEQFKQNALQLSDREMELLHQPFELKMVMAIRSDRMSLLNNLKDYLPNILRNCYELDALTEAQAEEAILSPAYKKDEAFLTPPFDYQDEALDNMLEFLTKAHTQKIETFQLQILCQTLERRVIEQQIKVVTLLDIGDIESIYKNYYDNQISSLSNPEDQLAARKLIEEGLIFEEEERRLSVYEGQIYKNFHISPELLSKLIDSHILRAEPSLQGGYTYELSHDTLVGPVLQSKEKRLEKERAQAEAREKSEREKELAVERRKRMRARRVAVVMTFLALFSLLACGIAYSQYRDAEEKRRYANEQQLKAEEALERFRQEKDQREKAEGLNQQIIIDKLKVKIQNFINANDPAAFQLARQSLEELKKISPNDPQISEFYKQLK